LIGGTFGGTVLTLVFLPALYAIWFKIKQVPENRQLVSATQTAVPGEMERSLVGNATA
jgi:Cu/Ag efflux pump CusA